MCYLTSCELVCFLSLAADKNIQIAEVCGVFVCIKGVANPVDDDYQMHECEQCLSFGKVGRKGMMWVI